MRGKKVRVSYAIVDDDDKPTGRYEVAPWIKSDKRFSWITSAARASDLVPIIADKED